MATCTCERHTDITEHYEKQKVMENERMEDPRDYGFRKAGGEKVCCPVEVTFYQYSAQNQQNGHCAANSDNTAALCVFSS